MTCAWTANRRWRSTARFTSDRTFRSGVRCWHPWPRFGRGTRRFDSCTRSVNCFKCDKPLARAFADQGDEEHLEPHHGLLFTAYGNYGSRVFDPIGSGPHLVIVVCDACVLDNADQVRMRRLDSSVVTTVAAWDPDTDYN